MHCWLPSPTDKPCCCMGCTASWCSCGKARGASCAKAATDSLDCNFSSLFFFFTSSTWAPSPTSRRRNYADQQQHKQQQHTQTTASTTSVIGRKNTTSHRQCQDFISLEQPREACQLPRLSSAHHQARWCAGESGVGDTQSRHAARWLELGRLKWCACVYLIVPCFFSFSFECPNKCCKRGENQTHICVAED